MTVPTDLSALARRVLPGQAFVLAALLSLAAAEGSEAQNMPRYGAGWLAGAAYVTELNPDGGTTPIEPGLSAIGAIHIDRWIGDSRRIGLRYQGAYQRPRFDWAQGERRIQAASADLSVLLRPILPEEGQPARPFLAAGLGGIWYDLGTGPQTSFSPGDAFHDGSSRILPVGVLAVGVDVPIPIVWHRYPVGIRLEAADHISFSSPLRSISDGARHGAVHHFRFTIGLHSSFSY